jgi:hypothetical protein
VLFGLGFDTATEVGLLTIVASTASKGVPLWAILITLFFDINSAALLFLIHVERRSFLKGRRKGEALIQHDCRTSLCVNHALPAKKVTIHKEQEKGLARVKGSSRSLALTIQQ